MPAGARLVVAPRAPGRTRRRSRSRCSGAMPTPRVDDVDRDAARRAGARRRGRRRGACSAARSRRGCAPCARAAPRRCRPRAASGRQRSDEAARRRLRTRTPCATRANSGASATRARSRRQRAGFEPRQVEQLRELRLERVDGALRRCRPAAPARRRVRAPRARRRYSPSACSGWRRSWLAAASSWLLARFAASAAARASMRGARLRLELGDEVDVLVARWRASRSARRSSWWPNASTKPSTTVITSAVYRCTGPPSSADAHDQRHERRQRRSRRTTACRRR